MRRAGNSISDRYLRRFLKRNSLVYPSQEETEEEGFIVAGNESERWHLSIWEGEPITGKGENSTFEEIREEFIP